MAKSSRVKRRAQVRSARSTRGPVLWYAVTAVVVVVGVALIVVSRSGESSAGIALGQHWHAALGVYDCDGWLDDGSGDGLWVWPAATSDQRPARVDSPSAYAGLHSHADGIIHLEPATSEEAGERATVGKYFEFGGWDVDETSFDFLGTARSAGDMCGEEAGVLEWSVNGEAQTGDPAGFVLSDGDVVVIAFVPEDTDLSTLGQPPSVANLENAADIETPPGVMPTVTNPPPTDASAGESPTTAGEAPETTAAPSAPTSAP